MLSAHTNTSEQDLDFSQWCWWGFKSTWSWRFVVKPEVPNVSENYSAFIFRVKQSKKNNHDPLQHHELQAQWHSSTSPKTWFQILWSRLVTYKSNYWGCMTFNTLLQMFIVWDKISLKNYPQKIRIDYSATQKEKQQLKLKMKDGQKSNKGTGGYCNLHDIFTT